jgi:anti-sigma factor RsiW
MTDARDIGYPTDEELVAYLDGELPAHERTRLAQRIAADHDLQRRLILLSSGNRPFREAFGSLLDQAPRARLETMLAGLPMPDQKASGTAPRRRGWGVGMRAIAASLLLFLAGFGAGWFMPTFSRFLEDEIATESASDEDWRQTVAEYLTLYTSETLASIPDNAAVREQEVATVGAKIGMALSPQKLALPALTLKRAQLLEYDRKPLGQITYLDPQSGPVALCIIADDGPDADQQTEQRQGFNIVYWSRGSRNFMLLGRVPQPRLKELANDLSTRLTG